MTIFKDAVVFARTYWVGVIAAATSTFFAGYMLLDGHRADIDIKVAINHVPVVNKLQTKSQFPIVPKRRNIPDSAMPQADQIFTGSVPVANIQRTKTETKSDFGLPKGRIGNQPNVSYVVRVATPSMALLEGGGKLWNVEPGHLLPGAGRVLRIERRKKKWVVVTNLAEINEAHD